MVENQRRLEKELADLNARLLSGGSSETEVQEIAGISLIASGLKVLIQNLCRMRR